MCCAPCHYLLTVSIPVFYQVIVKNSKDFAEEAKVYCLDNKPPCQPGDVPTSLFTDLLTIYFASPEKKVQSQAMEILKEQAGALDVVATLQVSLFLIYQSPSCFTDPLCCSCYRRTRRWTSSRRGSQKHCRMPCTNRVTWP